MKIAFLGDVHGRVFHAIAVLVTWQRRSGHTLDIVIQTGDLGTFPDRTALDEATARFAAQDPTELDFARLLAAEGKLAGDLRAARKQLTSPIHFLRGNHEDFTFLKAASAKAERCPVSVDPFDLYHYVPDGTIVERDGVRIGFLGGMEAAESDPRALDERTLETFLRCRPQLDVLVTHDAPYGLAKGYRVQVQGSPKIAQLVETIQPRYHIAGHYHHLNGPRTYGKTTFLGLNILVPSSRRDPLQRVQPGSMAVLDTEADSLQIVTADWLSDIRAGFDFGAFASTLRSDGPG